MSESLRCVFVANGRIEANQVQAFLEARGIPSAQRGETLSTTHGLTIDGLGRVEVLVADADEAAARGLLASAEGGEFRLPDDMDVNPEMP